MKYIWAMLGIVFALLGFLFLGLGVYTLVGYYLPIHILPPTFRGSPLMTSLMAFILASFGIFGGLNLVDSYLGKRLN